MNILIRIRFSFANLLKYTNSFSQEFKYIKNKKVINLNEIFFYSGGPLSTVNYEEILKVIKRNGNSNIIIDVRMTDHVKRLGKIPTSVNIPISEIENILSGKMSEEQFKIKYNRKKPSLDTNIVFYCRSGNKARTAAEKAKDLGFQNVKYYPGSWNEWIAKQEG